MRNLTWVRGAAGARLAALGCAVLIVALAGCGITPGTQAGTSGEPSSTDTATVTVTVTAAASATTTASASTSTSTGCPGPQESVSWPTPPTVVMTQPQATTQATTSVKVGQTIELRLAFGHRWSVATTTLNGAFTLDQPAGYADTQTQTCDWHFTAKQAGSQDLTIVMGPICQPHMECPQSVVAYDVTITATA